MIRIYFVEPNTRKWKLWREACKKETEKLQESVKNGKTPVISDLYKRKCIKDEVFFGRDGPFHGKCAYCECEVTTKTGDIEHYRPKKGVTDENDNPILITNENGETVFHPGYYWLAYDWMNLLPACKDCNQPGNSNIGKRNRFPLANLHTCKPEEVCNEQRLLLNPLVDDPEEHISVDLKTGLFIPKTNQGTITINILGLNVRQGLPENRKVMRDFVRAQFLKLIACDDHCNSDEIIKVLKKIQAGETAFSYPGREAIKDAKKYLGEL